MSFPPEFYITVGAEGKLPHWFNRHAVSWAMTGPSDLFEGWVSHLYVDFSGWDDPKLKAWWAPRKTTDFLVFMFPTH